MQSRISYPGTEEQFVFHRGGLGRKVHAEYLAKGLKFFGLLLNTEPHRMSIASILRIVFFVCDLFAGTSCPLREY